MTITGITKKGSVSDPGNCQIEKGDVYPLSISGTNKNDEIITDFACLWSSSDESVATVSKDWGCNRSKSRNSDDYCNSK